VISPQYGICGINPRYQILLPLPLDKEYKDDRIKFLKEKILETFEIYNYMTNFTKTKVIENKFVAGFNYEQFLNGIEDEED
jgi:hypothetical protein